MDVRHQQTFQPGGRITTIQSLTIPPLNLKPTPRVAERAGRRYFDLMRRTFGGLITVLTREDGCLEVKAGPLTLLSFHPPTVITHGDRLQVTYPIAAGLLVQPAHRNTGWLSMRLEPQTLTLHVEDYYGRLVGPNLHPLRKWFYLATQSALHLILARRYLTELHRALQHEEDFT